MVGTDVSQPHVFSPAPVIKAFCWAHIFPWPLAFNCGLAYVSTVFTAKSFYYWTPCGFGLQTWIMKYGVTARAHWRGEIFHWMSHTGKQAIWEEANRRVLLSERQQYRQGWVKLGNKRSFFLVQSTDILTYFWAGWLLLGTHNFSCYK